MNDELEQLSKYFRIIQQEYTFVRGGDDSLVFPLTISEIAKASNTTVHSIRNYDDERLIESVNMPGSKQRRYDQKALNRVRFIRAARESGLLILDIKPLLYALNNKTEKRIDEAVFALKSKIIERQGYLSLLSKLLQEINEMN